MLKFNATDIEILYRGICELLENDSYKFSNKEFQAIQTLQEKLLSTGKINNVLNESNIQLLDKVKFNKTRGYVSGEIGGKLIVMVQGNTYLVDPKELKEFNVKSSPSVLSPMKFDEKTQKLLFEQYIKCGIYQGNTPVKIQNCYVKYNTWQSAKNDDPIKVLVEGSSTFMPKSQVRIFENLNDFANEENYVQGVLIDVTSGEAIKNVLINVIDYTNAIGDADSIRVILMNSAGEQEIQSVPKDMVKTLSV